MTNSSKRRALLVLGGALALAACGGAGSESNAANTTAESATGNASAVNASQANATAPVTEAPAPVAAGGAVTADYMVGKWSAMDEDCGETLEFRKDGTVVTPFGDAKWTLAGDKLAVDFGDGSKQDPSTIKVLSQDRIEISKKSGGKETQKRC